MSASGELPRLEAIIDASGVAQEIEALLPIGVRPRQLTVRTLLLGILATQADQRPAHLARIHQALRGLPEADKRRLSVTCAWKSGPHELTYRQVERTFMLVVKALCKQSPDGRPSQALSEIMDRLIEASVQMLGCPDSRSLAIDWSDYESFARPPRKVRAQGQGRQSQAPRSAGPEQQDAPSQQAQQDENEDHDQDEDEQTACADTEAAWGHRKTNHPSRSETFFGYYLQAATIVKEENGPQIAELVRRIQLTSCDHDPPEQIVPVLERMREDGIPVADLLADSGYAYRTGETFAMPMRAAGAKLVIDLHPNDRGMKGTHMGAIIANSNLYCPATPKALLQLGPLAPGATEKQAAEHDRRCRELSHYKLSPLSAHDADGYHRAICPAAAGKLRCPLRPASMSLSHKHPSILSPPESAPVCCTQQTITVPPTVNAKTAQKHDYPSKTHRASYTRRTAAERSFSRLYDPASNDISRGWSRLIGLTPNALMLTCAFITANIRVTDAFNTRQAANHRRAEHGRPPRKRARRRRSLHDLLEQANAPPAITA